VCHGSVAASVSRLELTLKYHRLLHITDDILYSQRSCKTPGGHTNAIPAGLFVGPVITGANEWLSRWLCLGGYAISC
jgi:hypothetical protein